MSLPVAHGFGGSFLILELFQDPLLNILLVMEAVPLFGMTVGSLKVLLV